MRLDGKTTVITGASSGIGACLAFSAARRGATLVLVARRGHLLERLAEEIRRMCPETPEPLVASCDVSDRKSLQEALGRARSQVGPTDILINNAGISLYGLAELTDPTDLQTLLDVNLFGPLHGILEVLPDMRARSAGMIVNVISAAAIRGVPYLAGYGASKAGLAALGQSLRSELADTGVRVLNVYPGYTKTPLFAQEKIVGGARRPDGPYAAATTVAEQIIRGIEGNRTELVLSREGRALSAVARLAPRFLDRALAVIARRLRVPETQTGSGTPLHAVRRLP